MGADGTIHADEIEKPENYLNLTEVNLTKYPHLLLALNNTNRSFYDVPRAEWYSLKELFGGSWKNVFYQGRYFYVRLFGFV